MIQRLTEISAATRALSEYIAGALARPLPVRVAEKARHHILDTLAAMVSGSRLAPRARLLPGLPLALPVLAVVGLWSFIATINEFAIASAILQTVHHFTLPVGMRGFIDQQYGQRWGYFAAGSLLAALPAALLFMWLQRWIVSGLSQGAVKG